MHPRSVLSAALVIAGARADAQRSVPEIPLRAGMVITRSVRIVPRAYRLVADSATSTSVITIRGSNITVDFAGASLEGAATDANPDEAKGVAIRVEGGTNITITHAKVRGYKIAILARGTRNLRLLDNDVSYNWKPRLYSLIEHESLADWLSHHKNDNDEWLRFGAAIYLTDVHGGELRDNRAVQGMEGVMLTRTDSMRIVNNTIAFNSGVGIGLYRSNDNVIMHNRVDYNVRGYSHGFFRRGQDSADLLVYEQSSRNLVAYNSMTHGGDGLFLWAGQHTMDTGEGGANDNLFFGNDFSFAPTNGMEATFSRNIFARNRVEGSDHGLWGGYSFNSLVVGNEFIRNRIGIAIEHGQADTIAENRFDHNGTSVQLWAAAIEPSEWQYPKRRDTRSMRYSIERNEISGDKVGFRVSDTRESRIAGNAMSGVDSAMVFKDTASLVIAGEAATRSNSADRLAPTPILGAWSPFGDSLALRDRSAIIVNEWGPFDWRSPMLWPSDSARRLPLPLRVLGPPGAWRLVGKRGVAQLSRASGRVGDTVVVTPIDANDWQLDLEYRGGALVSPRGQVTAAGSPYRFSYSHFEPRAQWDVRFYAWADSSDPRTRTDAFARALTRTPIASERVPRMDYMWYRPTVKGVPQAKFAIVATSQVTLPPGVYTLRTLSDDAVRVWVDGALVIDNWTPHETAANVAPLGGGMHALRVEHYQVDGWTELRVDIVRGTQRAGGSPGPH